MANYEEIMKDNLKIIGPVDYPEMFYKCAAVKSPTTKTFLSRYVGIEIPCKLDRLLFQNTSAIDAGICSYGLFKFPYWTSPQEKDLAFQNAAIGVIDTPVCVDDSLQVYPIVDENKKWINYYNAVIFINSDIRQKYSNQIVGMLYLKRFPMQASASIYSGPGQLAMCGQNVTNVQNIVWNN